MTEHLGVRPGTSRARDRDWIGIPGRGPLAAGARGGHDRTLSHVGRKRARPAQTLGYGNVEVRLGDGLAGAPDRAPFDRIIVTAAAERVPPTPVDQLGGRRGDAACRSGRITERNSWSSSPRPANRLAQRGSDRGALRAAAAGTGARVVMILSYIDKVEEWLTLKALFTRRVLTRPRLRAGEWKPCPPLLKLRSRCWPRCALALIAVGAAGCSADTSRFNDSPFASHGSRGDRLDRPGAPRQSGGEPDAFATRASPASPTGNPGASAGSKSAALQGPPQSRANAAAAPVAAARRPHARRATGAGMVAPPITVGARRDHR